MVSEIVLAFIFSWMFSGAVGMVITYHLHRRYRRSAFAVLFLTLLGGPFGFFLTFSLATALREQRSKAIFAEIPEDKTIAPGNFPNRRLGEGAATSPRPEVAVYLSKYHTPSSFRRLKSLTFSLEEETRLLAFSILNRKESALNTEIDRLLHRLEKAQTEERLSLLAALVELYSEFVFLGLVERELEDFYLSSAEGYARETLQLREHGRYHYLLGRILLQKRNFEEAEKHFTQAMQLKFPQERILPYLLECAYMRRNHLKIREIVSTADKLSFVDHKAWNIFQFWTRT